MDSSSLTWLEDHALEALYASGIKIGNLLNHGEAISSSTKGGW